MDVAGFADAVRFGNVGEREGSDDREGKPAGLDQPADLAERVERAAGSILL